MRYLAYLRTSTKEQNPERQITAVKEFAAANKILLADEDIYIEQESGKNFNRAVWQSLKQIAFRPGVTLVITELDRLGRNMAAVKDEWHWLTDKGVEIIVMENELLNTSGRSDLERALISSIVFELLAYMAEKERQKLKSRQAQGIKNAREKGLYKGRKPVEIDMDAFARIYKRWRMDGEITAKKAMELLGVKKDVFYNKVKKYEKSICE